MLFKYMRIKLYILCLVCFISALCSAQKTELIVQLGHTDAVSCSAISSDGNYIITGSTDHTIKLWQVQPGFLIRYCYGLREDEKLTGCVTVKIRYKDFETTTRQEVIDYTALDDELIAKAKDIFNKSYQGGRPVRFIGFRFNQLIPFTIQKSFF